MHRILSISVLFAFFGSLPAATPTPAEVAASIEAVTGARTKVVWEQGFTLTTGNLKWDALEADYRLLGLDTRGPKAGQVDTLIRGPQSVWNPWITHDGSRVIYTDFTPYPHSVHIMNWDGTGKAKLSSGSGLCYWRNQANGQEWVYFGTAEVYAPTPVKRFRLDNPTIVELVWSGDVGLPFTVSADGKYAAGEAPWPKVGFYDLQAGTHTSMYSKYGQSDTTGGCNTRMAPDNSYRFFHYADEHVHIRMYDAGGENPRKINVAFAQLLGRGHPFVGAQSWAPRWSNDARFMTVNSPLERGHIYIAKFTPDYNGIEKHAQVSLNEHWPDPSNATIYLGPQNTYAYAWIDPAAASSSSVPPSGLHLGNGLRISRAPNGDLQVAAPGTEAAQLRLLAPDGRLVLEQRGNSGLFRVSRASLGTGIYVVQVQQPGGRFSRTVAVW